MDQDFWHERWHANQIAFHERNGNVLFTTHFPALELVANSRVFLPLCGKTRDIHWLLANGYRVAGAELSELAVQQLFDELGVVPQTESVGELMRYHGPGIDIFVGDIFALDSDNLGPVDATYDRAALVALPNVMREDYVKHVMSITGDAPQILITFEYDQALMEGPPFSVDSAHVHLYYESHYVIQPVEQIQIEGGLKGRVAATENVWRLTPRKAASS